jgi:transposase-like protein
MEFLVESLKKDKTASYADLKAKADEKKLEIYPIMFGRAQALLGIVKSAKRGQGKAAKAKAAKAPSGAGRPLEADSKSGQIRAMLATGAGVAEIAEKVGCTPALVYNVKARMGGAPKRGPGRPPKAKAAPAVALNSIEGIVAAVKGAEQQRSRLRSALEKIQAVLADALR